MHTNFRGLAATRGYGDLAQLLALGGGGFGGLPPDMRDFILANRPENPGETDALLNSGIDGLRMVPDAAGRYSTAVALSREVDELRGDPLMAQWLTEIDAWEAKIKDALLRARNFYPWDNRVLGVPVGRTARSAEGLVLAITQFATFTQAYVNKVPTMLQTTRARIAEREEARHQAAVDAQNRIDAEEIARKKDADLRIDNADKDIAIAKGAKLIAENDYEKLVKKMNAPKLFGIPLSIVVPVVLAGGVGVFIIARRSRS